MAAREVDSWFEGIIVVGVQVSDDGGPGTNPFVDGIVDDTRMSAATTMLAPEIGRAHV